MNYSHGDQVGWGEDTGHKLDEWRSQSLGCNWTCIPAWMALIRKSQITVADSICPLVPLVYWNCSLFGEWYAQIGFCKLQRVITLTSNFLTLQTHVLLKPMVLRLKKEREEKKGKTRILKYTGKLIKQQQNNKMHKTNTQNYLHLLFYDIFHRVND